jgi:phage tail-like protein
MNVNGSRFDLLLGREDWGRCVDEDGADARTLASWWAGVPPDGLPWWDDERAELSLPPVAIALPRTPAEAPLTLDARRAAAADRNRSVYRIGDDRRSLLAFSAGSRRESTFWPAGPSDCGEERGRARLDFEPASIAAPVLETYHALAVTADDYLVVAFEDEGRRGFLAFDLVAGGPPVETLWPLAPFRPFDMAARPGGGVFVLERGDGSSPSGGRLWELDCRLAVVETAQATTTLAEAVLDDFQPAAGPPRQKPAVTFPGGVSLADLGVEDPIAVEALAEGGVLVLERDGSGRRSRVSRVHRDGQGWHAVSSRWLDELPDAAHDFVLGRGRLYRHGEAADRLFVATAGGNQARAYSIAVSGGGLDLGAATDLFPLRRFGGRALVAISPGRTSTGSRGEAHYDSGIPAPAWTPIVQQPRALFRRSAELVTPVFDSRELGTTWDRVTLDACVPADTSVEIWSRAGDERADRAGGGGGTEEPQVAGAWSPEPRPLLRPKGPELPWLRGEAARATRAEAGVGTWELLLQRARGRYLQLKVRMTSANGAATPRLRALRAWSPRFSYPRRFLPAVYREDVAAGDFLERWLANFESTLTHVEDRVVNLQALFDPRTAPAESLAWLAGWFDVALDAGWDESRRRLFVRHAMDFFRWRGTAYGLRLALELAFDRCFDPRLFEGPAALPDRPQAIRLVEAYQTRLIGALAAGDPGALPGPREVRREALWSPAEGNAGLQDRHAKSRGREPSAVDLVTPFPLVPPAPDPARPRAVADWREFCQSALGFVPEAGAAERARWQAFLRARYEQSDALDDRARVAALNEAHGAAYRAFADVALPRDWPGGERPAPAADWRAFCERARESVTRGYWTDFLARRYRRVERLNLSHGTRWPGFQWVAQPDAVPETEAAQADWLLFERMLLAIHRTKHRFSVLLPVADVSSDPADLEARLGLARRIVDLEKPAHTVYDVRFYWALFRVGEARLGLDTLLGQGSRAPELVPAAVLGRTYVGASFVGGPPRPEGGDRLPLGC